VDGGNDINSGGVVTSWPGPVTGVGDLGVLLLLPHLTLRLAGLVWAISELYHGGY